MRAAAAGLALALGLAGLWALRGERIEAAPLLPMSFAHEDHREVNCLECHHEFVDDTGLGFCIDCHKREPAIAREIEAMFHGLCRDCHVERQRAGEESGPTRRCLGCHEGDDRP